MENLAHYLWALWLIPAPIMTYFFVRFVQTRRAYVYRGSTQGSPADPFITFQITSKACPPIVGETIRHLRRACQMVGVSAYRLQVVTDDSDAIRRYGREAEVIVVPPGYRPPNGSRYKAKSLQWAVERRKALQEIEAGQWIFLLDEESFVTPQTLMATLTYLRQPHPAPIAEGPITYPHGFFQVNWLCAVMECLRPYICYDCLALMKRGGPTHLHGSNLLVRSDVEATIGWDHPKCDSSEDQRFCLEARMRFDKDNLFGWHGGVLEEQPPLRIRDAIRQRQGWFVGNLHNMLYCPVSRTVKFWVGVRWVAWASGFFAGLASFAVFVVPQNIPDWLHPFLYVNTALWLIGYQIGGYLNLRPHPLRWWQRIGSHMGMVVLAPFAGLIDTFAAISAPYRLIRYQRVATPKMVTAPLSPILDDMVVATAEPAL